MRQLDSLATYILTSLQQVSSSSDPLDKTLSKLKKKLRQIETLEEKRASGEQLEANQVCVCILHT